MRYQVRNLAIRVALAILLLALSGAGAYGDGSLEDKVLRNVANEQGLALHRLAIGVLQPTAFPLIGVTLYQAKVIDTETGTVYSTVVDQEGKPQSLEEARATERAAYEAHYGRLHADLYDRLQTMVDDDRLTVAIWLKADGLAPLDRPDFGHQPSAVEDGKAELPPPDLDHPKPTGPIEEKADPAEEEVLAARAAAIRAQQAEQRATIEAAEQANLAHLATQVAVLQEPLLADLEAQGYTPVYVSPIAPLVYVELPKSAVLALAQRADVDTIYGPNENFDLMNSAKPTQKADIVDGWGFDGSGVDVAILEDSRIEFNNPYLNTGTTRVPGDPNVDNHATATAGMVASQHSTYQGIAQGVDLFSANATTYGDANLSAAMDWSVTQGVNVINNSWGGNAGNTSLNVHDRHLDYIVRNHARTVTVASGNENDGCGGGTPGV